MTDLNSLHYTDETDKCYGLAGMAITLAACDSRGLLVGMDLDAPSGDSMAVSQDFFFRGNPRMPAKYVWAQTLESFRLAVELVLGNLMCRSYVHGHRRALERSTADALRAFVRDEGAENCALEADEADSIFDEAYELSDRIFRHSGIHDIAGEFAALMAERRSLDATEIFEFMSRRGLR